jgi:hypothetical protein
VEPAFHRLCRADDRAGECLLQDRLPHGVEAALEVLYRRRLMTPC